MASEGDQLYRKATLDSGADLTLDSGGSITFEAVKDLDQASHEKSSSDLAWVSAQGKGTTDETLRHSQLVAQGKVVIKAVDGLKIDLKEINQQTVSQTIDAMVQADPQLAWLKQAEARGDVDWRRVKEVHDSFKYSHSGLGAGAQLVIAIVVSYLTAGAASGAIATAGAGTSMAGATAAATATASAGWLNAAGAVIAGGMASNAAISTINNRGNLGAVVKDVTSRDALRSYAVSGVTAGLTAGGYDDWTATQTGTSGALPNSGQVITHGELSRLDGLGRFAGNQLLQNGTSTVLDRALGGDSQLGDALRSSLANTFAAAGFNLIGDQTLPEKWDMKDGSPGKIALHAVMGGLAAEAAGGDFKAGAWAAGVNEALVDRLAQQYAGMDGEQKKKLLVMNSQLIGVLTVAAQGGDEKALQTGSWVAGSATQYNYLNHQDVKELEEALKECLADNQCEKSVRNQFQERSAANNDRLNACSQNGNCAAIQLEVQQGSEALAKLSGLSGTAEGIVDLMRQGQAGDLNAINTRIAFDQANQKRDKELVALGKDPEKLALTAKAQALADYQTSLEQELLANEELARLFVMSDAQLDELAPGWRDYQQQVLGTTKGIAQGMALVGEALEPGLLDALGPTAKAARIAGIFQALSKLGKSIPNGVLAVAGKLDGMIAGKAPSVSELAPFELSAQAKLTQEIQKANRSLASFGKEVAGTAATGGAKVVPNNHPLSYDISKWGEYGLPSDGVFSRTLTAEQYRAYKAGREFSFSGKTWTEGGYPDGMGFIGAAEEARGLTTVAGYREGLKLDYNPKFVLEFQLREPSSLQNALKAPYLEFVPGGKTGAGLREWNFPGLSSKDIINSTVRVLE